MSTTKEIFEATKEILRAQAFIAINESLDEIYNSYLPHVESDTQSNVYFRTSEWLERFFADALQEDDIKIDLLRSGWNGEKARQKIYEANKTEITKAIGRDLAEKIESLKAELNAVYRRY